MSFDFQDSYSHFLQFNMCYAPKSINLVLRHFQRRNRVSFRNLFFSSTYVQNCTKTNNFSYQKFVTNFLLEQIQSEQPKL